MEDSIERIKEMRGNDSDYNKDSDSDNSASKSS